MIVRGNMEDDGEEELQQSDRVETTVRRFNPDGKLVGIEVTTIVEWTPKPGVESHTGFYL